MAPPVVTNLQQRSGMKKTGQKNCLCWKQSSPSRGTSLSSSFPSFVETKENRRRLKKRHKQNLIVQLRRTISSSLWNQLCAFDLICWSVIMFFFFKDITLSPEGFCQKLLFSHDKSLLWAGGLIWTVPTGCRGGGGGISFSSLVRLAGPPQRSCCGCYIAPGTVLTFLG